METLSVRVVLLDGSSFEAEMTLEDGAGEDLYHRLPAELAKGIWRDTTTFIPPAAIAHVKIVAGPVARFPDPEAGARP